MTSRKKRLEALKFAKGDVSYRILEKFLEDNGYELARSNGSHFMFRKSGSPSITIPVHNNEVKRVYIKDILKLLEL